MNRFLCSILLASLAIAEERTFPLDFAPGLQDKQQIALTIRAIAEPESAAVEGEALRVRGSQPQIEAAAFLVDALAKPGNSPDYSFAAQESIRVLEFADAQEVQELQEAATAMRSLLDIRRLFTWNAKRKIVARGTPEQLEKAEWVLSKLARDAGGGRAETRISGNRDQIARVYTIPQYRDVQDFQEVATLIRSIGEMRYAFTYNPTRKLCLRGSPEQMAMTDFLLSELTASQDTKQIHRIRPGGEVLRVFEYPATTVQSFQEMATAMRTTSGIAKMFTFNSKRKIAARGAADEIALAEWMLSQPQDAKPDFQLGAVREFRLPQDLTVQQLQEAATVARSIAEIARLMTHNETRRVFARGSQQQIDLAAWVFQQIATPPAGGVSPDYAYGTDIVKHISLNNEMSLLDFQQKAVQVRRDTGIPRMFTYNKPRSIFIRGSLEQVRKAEALLRQP